MRENFIIVQHFVYPNKQSYNEGERLHQLYRYSPLPYLAIINPLTGGEMFRFSKIDIESVDRFMEYGSSPSPPPL